MLTPSDDDVGHLGKMGKTMSSIAHLSFQTKSRAMAPDSYRAWKDLSGHDAWSPEKVADVQRERSLEIARFAFENSAFYREFYGSHGITAADLRDPAAFWSLPFLTKDHVRENYASITTAEATPKTAGKSVSSGSTGEPLTVLSDARAPVRAYEWRAMGWWGVDPWENGATVDRSWRSARRTLQHKLFWWPTRRSLFHTLKLEESTLRAFVAEWQKYKPQYVVGFIGGVSQVASYAAANGVRLAPPKAVAVTAGPLFEGHRAEMQEIFGCPVYNVYRSTESNWLAGECGEQEGLHVYEDIKNLEVIRPDGSATDIGEEGETVFTDFENRVFPLVRYRIGDRTARLDGACGCGRPFRRVATIQGRIVDTLVLPSGRVLTGDIFDYFEGCAESIAQWQVYQREDRSIEVTVRLTEDRGAPAVADERVGRLRARVEGEVPVTLTVVERIDPVRGKFRPIVSDAPKS